MICWLHFSIRVHTLIRMVKLDYIVYSKYMFLCCMSLLALAVAYMKVNEECESSAF